MQGEIFPSGVLRNRIRRAVALTLTGAVLTGILSGCSKETMSTPFHKETTAPAETVATEPPATIPPDGNPEDVSCKGTYTADTVDGTTVVASMDGQELNNAKLNVLYRLALNSFQAEEGQTGPDFSKPLDTQICGISQEQITWQQYFLQKALDNWKGIQELERRSHMKMIRNELNFAVDHAKHDEYMVDVPVNDTVLYGEDASFKLSRQERPYMEALPDTMKTMAESKGYSSLQEMLGAEFGPSVTETDFNDLTYLANYAYLYFISLTYDPKPTEEEIQAQLAQMPAQEGKLVDFRHILLYPDEATVGADGKISGNGVMDAAFKQAESLFKKFTGSKKQDDVAFSVLAHDYTRDYDSIITGGLYANVHKGQMIDPLDAWLFDPARQVGDVDMIQSDYGWHVVYFKGQKDIRTPEAKKILLENRLKYIMEECEYNYPMTLDYSKIQLHPSQGQGKVTMDGDILYPDIAHERFPEVPVYIQQDYAKAPYGNYKVSSHGCGISALAMLSTYMTDELHTPATLAVQFGHYNGLHGTDWRMFTEAPPELGYFLYKRSGTWQTVEDNLREGRMAISLQVEGYFTRAGHYLVISELKDDGRVVIRDSNVYNYQRLPEHKEDLFNPKKLLPNNQGFWVYDKKVTSVANCSRCGTHETEYKPQLFKEDYICHKCEPVLQRRAAFMDLCRFS